MPLEFIYTIDQVKDCINQTEQQLRALISTVLSRKYGLDWEYSSSVWNDDVRKSLESRRKDEQGRFPHQVVSQHLLDYSDILHLKTIIGKEWPLFSPIFGASKEKILYRFEDLHYLRNPEMHSRPNLLLHQKYLCLGVCGEFLTAIDHWYKGYEYHVKEYELLLRFPVYM